MIQVVYSKSFQTKTNIAEAETTVFNFVTFLAEFINNIFITAPNYTPLDITLTHLFIFIYNRCSN